MKTENETEVVEYTRDKKIADPNSLVLDGVSDVETPLPTNQESPLPDANRFSWHKEQDPRIIVHHQPEIAIHIDPKDGSIIIRQEDFFRDADQIVYFQPEFAEKVAQAILAFAKEAK